MSGNFAMAKRIVASSGRREAARRRKEPNFDEWQKEETEWLEKQFGDFVERLVDSTAGGYAFISGAYGPSRNHGADSNTEEHWEGQKKAKEVLTGSYGAALEGAKSKVIQIVKGLPKDGLK